MPVLKLTRRNIAAIGAVEKDTLFFDDELAGFGLRKTPGGSATFFVEYRPGAGGRGVSKRRMKLGAADILTPEDARKAAREILADVTRGADPAKDRATERTSATVGELLDDYIGKHVRPLRKASTAAGYEWQAEKHIKPAIGSKRASALTRADVADMHAEIAADAPYVANRSLALLSAAFEWGKKRGAITAENPVAGVERVREQGRERYLTPDEIDRLAAALDEAETEGLPWEPSQAKTAPKNGRTKFSPHVTGAIRLLLLTGCRLREILNLRWDEVDFGRGLLNLPDSKTGRKTVVLSTGALEVLEALPRIGVFVIAGDSAGTKDEKPRSDLNRPWRAICKRAGLSGVRLHDLRHTFASLGAAGGVGLPAIGRLLGHKSARTTQRYAHLADDAAKRAADLIGQGLTGLSPKKGPPSTVSPTKDT